MTIHHYYWLQNENVLALFMNLSNMVLDYPPSIGFDKFEILSRVFMIIVLVRG